MTVEEFGKIESELGQDWVKIIILDVLHQHNFIPENNKLIDYSIDETGKISSVKTGHIIEWEYIFLRDIISHVFELIETAIWLGYRKFKIDSILK